MSVSFLLPRGLHMPVAAAKRRLALRPPCGEDLTHIWYAIQLLSIKPITMYPNHYISKTYVNLCISMEMHTPVEFPQDVTSELHGHPKEIAAAAVRKIQLHDLARMIIRDPHHLLDGLRGW